MGIQPVLRELKQSLRQLYGERLKGAYLLGSRARDDAEADSDKDIAVVLRDGTDRWAARRRQIGTPIDRRFTRADLYRRLARVGPYQPLPVAA